MHAKTLNPNGNRSPSRAQRSLNPKSARIAPLAMTAPVGIDNLQNTTSQLSSPLKSRNKPKNVFDRITHSHNMDDEPFNSPDRERGSHMRSSTPDSETTDIMTGKKKKKVVDPHKGLIQPVLPYYQNLEVFDYQLDKLEMTIRKRVVQPNNHSQVPVWLRGHAKTAEKSPPQQVQFEQQNNSVLDDLPLVNKFTKRISIIADGGQGLDKHGIARVKTKGYSTIRTSNNTIQVDNLYSDGDCSSETGNTYKSKQMSKLDLESMKRGYYFEQAKRIQQNKLSKLLKETNDKYSTVTNNDLEVIKEIPRSLVPENICHNFSNQRQDHKTRMVKVRTFIEKQGELDTARIMQQLKKQDARNKQICTLAKKSYRTASHWAANVESTQIKLIPKFQKDEFGLPAINAEPHLENTEICPLKGITYFTPVASPREVTIAGFGSSTVGTGAGGSSFNVTNSNMTGNMTQRIGKDLQTKVDYQKVALQPMSIPNLKMLKSQASVKRKPQNELMVTTQSSDQSMSRIKPSLKSKKEKKSPEAKLDRLATRIRKGIEDQLMGKKSPGAADPLPSPKIKSVVRSFSSKKKF